MVDGLKVLLHVLVETVQHIGMPPLRGDVHFAAAAGLQQLLMEHPGEVYSPNQIYAKVWKDEPYGTENTVAVHIRHLREKVEINPAEPRYLKVIWGRGYKIDAE